MAHPVAVVSYPAWKRLFGGDSSVVGRKVIINGGTYEIVGIAAREFSGVIPIVTPEFWVPLSQHDQLRPGNARAWDSRGNNSYSVIARARPGVSVAAITNRMNSLVTELRQVYPDDYKDSGIAVVPQGDAGIHPMFRSA